MLVSELIMRPVLAYTPALIFSLTSFIPVHTKCFAQVAAQAATSQSVQLKGLKERVTITREERGIPYIDARNDEDLYFAQGYATAADRLWQLDLFRPMARCGLAEVLGDGANQEA